jgi:hypothetical protein
MRLGRRPLFFFGTGAVCLVLLPVTPGEFRWVNLAAAGVALFWAVLLAIEETLAHRDGAFSPPSPPADVVEPEDLFRDERTSRPERNSGESDQD